MPPERTRYPCSKCSRRFAHPDSCRRHESACTGPVRLDCSKCGSVFAYKSYRERHEQSCLRPVRPAPVPPSLEDLTCGKCGRIYQHPGSLARHKLTCGTSPSLEDRTCGTCGRVYQHPGSLARHKLTCGTGPSLEDLTCDKCERTFAHLTTLARHKLTCGVPLSCRKGCGKDFDSARQRGVHERQCCYRARKYFCPVCYRVGFFTRAEYDEHAQSGNHHALVGAMPLSPPEPISRFYSPSHEEVARIKAALVAVEA